MIYECCEHRVSKAYRARECLTQKDTSMRYMSQICALAVCQNGVKKVIYHHAN